MLKTISISPMAMLNLASGKPLTMITSEKFKGSRIVSASYNDKTGDFSILVESSAFEGEHFGTRLPQEIRIEA